MKRLNTSQLEYVLFHLRHHISISDELRESFRFLKPDELRGKQNNIIFLVSDEKLETSKVRFCAEIPILFPVLSSPDVFYIDENNNLIFCHDLLKSAFYLLSGFQEYNDRQAKDKLNRFSFENSIQRQLSITDKPIVNYYFNFIVQGIEAHQKRSLSKPKLFSSYGFLLSHDIDKIDTYDFNYVVYKFKELVGLRKNKLGFVKNLKVFIHGLFQFLNFINRENPYWNFDFMRDVERQRKLRSTFYFLDQGVKHSDAYYSFAEPRMISLYAQLKKEDCEIGLHGSVKSIESESVMNASLIKLKEASEADITGIRQHRLLWKHPTTALVQEKCGFEYDTTLGFAAHEGFRNSYCWPFKLYDFEKDKMINIWEFPLNVMDVTLFAYQNYSVTMAMDKCKALIDEIKKFGGIFSLLFHNSAFDEVTYPGITKFYLDLLDHVETECENILGSELAPKMEQLSLTK